MLILFLSVFLLMPALVIAVGAILSAPKYSGPVTDHFNGKRFYNLHGARLRGLKDLFRWLFNREKRPWKREDDPQYGKRPLNHYKDGIRITYVNHSTFLIQVNGVNILTDPVWSKRVSPFRWIGPLRKRHPGIRLEDLPDIHVVLLSHNHYDHLDLPTLYTIFGAHHPLIVTPLGVRSYLQSKGIPGAKDLDWWEKISVPEEIKIEAVPAQHFSGRGLFDRNATLWCGYVIATRCGNIYFAGDTGYHENIFKQIGQRIGNIRLAIIPIGAYKPVWFMSPVHTSPEEAVKVHLDVKAETSIASHFGTFPLGDDSPEDAIEDLNRALRQYEVSPEAFLVLKEGEARVF